MSPRAEVAVCLPFPTPDSTTLQPVQGCLGSYWGNNVCVNLTVEAQSVSGITEFIDSPRCLVVRVHVTMDSLFGPLLTTSAWESPTKRVHLCSPHSPVA